MQVANYLAQLLVHKALVIHMLQLYKYICILNVFFFKYMKTRKLSYRLMCNICIISLILAHMRAFKVLSLKARIRIGSPFFVNTIKRSCTLSFSYFPLNASCTRVNCTVHSPRQVYEHRAVIQRLFTRSPLLWGL